MKSMKEIIFNRSKKDPNILGETLREACFVPDKYGNDCGGYSTFDLTPDFLRVEPMSDRGRAILDVMMAADLFLEMDGSLSPKEQYEEYLQDSPGLQIFSNGDIDVAWYWDGDGTLLFISHELGMAVISNDCKKDYVWKFVKYNGGKTNG